MGNPALVPPATPHGMEEGETYLVVSTISFAIDGVTQNVHPADPGETPVFVRLTEKYAENFLEHGAIIPWNAQRKGRKSGTIVLDVESGQIEKTEE